MGAQGIAAKTIQLVEPWTTLSSARFIMAAAVLVSVFWLVWHFFSDKHDSSVSEYALQKKTEVAKMFSRTSVLLISICIASAYIGHSEEMMDAAFEAIPTYYILYILVFVAYDTFWEMFGKFTGSVGRDESARNRTDTPQP